MKNLVVGSIVLMLVTLGWSNPSRGEQAPAPQGELRIVDKSPLNFVAMVYNVFEHFMDLDRDGTLAPRLATRPTKYPDTESRNESPAATAKRPAA